MLKSRAKIYSKMVRKKRQREAPVDFGIAGLGLGRGVGERVNPIPEGVIGLKEDDLPYTISAQRAGGIALAAHKSKVQNITNDKCV